MTLATNTKLRVQNDLRSRTIIGLTAEYPATLKLYPKLSGYADTQWKTWIGGYVDTRTSHMGTE